MTPFSFAYITDPQIGMNSTWGVRGPGADRNRLNAAIEFINTNDVSLVIFGGDQIHSTCNERTAEQLDVFEECVATLDVPWYAVAGNHDQLAPAESSPYVERGLALRFSMSHENASFIGLNASWLRGDFEEQCEDEEWAWLEKEFAAIPADCTHRFVISHWPLFSLHPGEEETYWNMPNRERVIELFKSNNVSCLLSGHWQQDIDANWHGIPLITSVGTSAPLQYPEELAFKVLTVFDDGWSCRRVAVGAM
ncbi:MAG: metallophosphoesterase [Lentisphaeria bacterium]|jgi:3',5'-cyclic AMP phosphodiesterase CpdA|nr:metallophosphoesterase [Lentisphaeria bacterium]MDP7741667.1 metallophosphoesterase [Lentisphaeria bacterium]